MHIGLHDDETGFPNLALMKLSAWYKAQGHSVEKFVALETYDHVFSSKVFTFTPTDPYLPSNTIRGGTGYGIYTNLPDEVEHTCPDYSLYGQSYSMGFLTRGCLRACAHCIVPKKEGTIRPHADIEEFARHKEVVLLDNNVLAHQHGLNQIEKMARMGLKVDFNQGLDTRLIDDSVAKVLKKLTWRRCARLACDSRSMLPALVRAVEHLRWNNVTPRRYFCYVLIKNVSEAAEIVRTLKTLDVDPFAQPFIDERGTPASPEQKAFARWVNMKAEYKSRTWEHYRDQHLKEIEENRCPSRDM